MTADEAIIQIRSDRGKFLPWGAQGGGPGTATRGILNPDTDNEEAPSKFMADLTAGDAYRSIQAGGGGYGDPLDRDPDAVLRDVRLEKVTSGHARDSYGVVIAGDPPAVDPTATTELRERMRRERGPLDKEPQVVRADRG